MLFRLSETIHGRDGCRLYVATPLPRFGRDEFCALLALARANSGYHSDLRGGDKIPGFQFRSPSDRVKFLVAAKRLAIASVPYQAMTYVDGRLHRLKPQAIQGIT